MVSATFLFQNSSERVQFFEKIFLLADTNIKVVLEMPFLSLSNADMKFGTEGLIWRRHVITKAIPKVKKVELIDKHEFVKTVQNKNF